MGRPPPKNLAAAVWVGEAARKARRRVPDLPAWRGSSEPAILRQPKAARSHDDSTLQVWSIFVNSLLRGRPLPSASTDRIFMIRTAWAWSCWGPVR